MFFFTEFYKTAYKVGKSFIKGIVPALLLVFIVEGTTHIDTFVWIDQTDKIAMQAQIPILIIGVTIFVLGNIFAYHIAKNRFEKVDL